MAHSVEITEIHSRVFDKNFVKVTTNNFTKEASKELI